MSDKECGKCKYFYPLKKVDRKGGLRDLTRGYCLAKSVFAKNKPGKPVFPPGAVTKELPYGRSKPEIVMTTQVVKDCPSFKE